ncbi:sulfur carrier protein ThiS [Rapidithrix thailandica]|uniref:Sulfur carrier protein ThiS n=1 Tax=Rapidithrix thailandica TaxID=413964 RepID=A0AAW9SGS3_9BACT
MEVFVNNKPYRYETSLSLEQVLTELGLKGKNGIAVAVNQKVVSKPQWPSFTLQNQDQITVITATQGG